MSSTTKISASYRVVIPKPVRDRLNLRPGQELSVFVRGSSIVLVPVEPISSMRGFLRGMESEFERDSDDRP